jgi:hypothetical protein
MIGLIFLTLLKDVKTIPVTITSTIISAQKFAGEMPLMLTVDGIDLVSLGDDSQIG